MNIGIDLRSGRSDLQGRGTDAHPHDHRGAAVILAGIEVASILFLKPDAGLVLLQSVLHRKAGRKAQKSCQQNKTGDGPGVH